MDDRSSAPAPAPRAEILVNCAASLDGRIAFARGVRARLSSAEDLARVQRLRARVDGVLVGVGTVVLDDPSLRVHWELLGRTRGNSPTRIVVDSTGRTPPTARVLDRTAPTLLVTSERAALTFPEHVRTVRFGADRVDLRALFEALPSLGIRSVLVEGGAGILSSVVRDGLFDRWTVYYAPVVVGGPTAPPMVAGPDTIGKGDLARVRLSRLSRLGEGFVAEWRPTDRRA